MRLFQTNSHYTSAGGVRRRSTAAFARGQPHDVTWTSWPTPARSDIARVICLQFTLVEQAGANSARGLRVRDSFALVLLIWKFVAPLPNPVHPNQCSHYSQDETVNIVN